MNNNIQKVIVLLLVLAALLPASTVCAQGVFGRDWDNEYIKEKDYGLMHRGGNAIGGYNITTELFGNNTLGGYIISTEQFGNDVPLGSGLLVLASAGAAYALKKRKNNIKIHKP